jgi:hypothetical protein
VAARRPELPAEVRPGSPLSDLRGRQPVRITVDRRNLVACGFRDQRVEIRSGSVSAVVLDEDRSLILLDRDGRMLLRARGDWSSYALGAVCRRAGLPRPTRLDRYGDRRAARAARTVGKRPSARAWPRAPGYRELRVRPPGFIPAQLMLACATVVSIGAGLGAGVGLALQLPGSAGSVRNLLTIAGGAAGGAAGLWLLSVGVRASRAAVRWAAASREIGSLAPWSPFYLPGGRRRREQLVTGAMVIGVPALIGWGPGVLIVALAHGPPWIGVTLGNLISGALLTLALPILAWRTARRVRDQRRAAREDLIEGIW